MNSPTIDFPDLDTDAGDDDPLAGLGLDLGEEITAVQQECDGIPTEDRIRETAERLEQSSNRVAEFLAKPVNGEPLYLDFETIPDFDRAFLFDLEPLPTMPPVDGQDALLPTDQFVSQSIPEIEAWFAKHNPPREWIECVLEAEKQSKKPRKGFLDAVDAHTKRIAGIAGAESDRVKLMSVRPLYCKILCVSFAIGNQKPVSIYAPDRMMEKHLIEMVWKMLARHSPVIGYGVSFFDIPVLLTRSMILGVHPGKILDRRKYGSKDILDLCKELFGDDRSITQGLKRVCRSLGIEPDAADVDGSHVYDLWKAGKVDEITAYCESDVRLVQRLHREKMAGYFCA